MTGQEYFAFYWTFPVPWIGFRNLPASVDEAAAASKTIRYSRSRVQTHVAQTGGVLLRGSEVAMMELEPDRGSPELGDALGQLLEQAEAQGAKLALADFSGHNGWRSHQYLARHYDHPCCELIPVSPEDVHLTGFNPYDNFEAWRRRTRQRIDGKPDHRQKMLAALGEMEGASSSAKAMMLNELGLRTYTGRTWTADNLRKFANNF